MNQNKEVALKYFSAFHNGQLDTVFACMADGAVVKYGTQPARPAADFFPETKEMISQLTFRTLGVYTSDKVTHVMIHFSFDMPGENSQLVTVEAVDIIEFNADAQITKITVIPNS